MKNNVEIFVRKYSSSKRVKIEPFKYLKNTYCIFHLKY